MGLIFYLQDIYQNPDSFTVTEKGGNKMMLGAIPYCYSLLQERIECNMKASYYPELLPEWLSPFVQEATPNLWSLAQHTARKLTAQRSSNYIDFNDDQFQDWPKKSPDIKVIECVWGIPQRTL